MGGCVATIYIEWPLDGVTPEEAERLLPSKY
jgi:hypothetical protein